MNMFFSNREQSPSCHPSRLRISLEYKRGNSAEDRSLENILDYLSLIFQNIHHGHIPCCHVRHARLSSEYGTLSEMQLHGSAHLVTIIYLRRVAVNRNIYIRRFYVYIAIIVWHHQVGETVLDLPFRFCVFHTVQQVRWSVSPRTWLCT